MALVVSLTVMKILYVAVLETHKEPPYIFYINALETKFEKFH